jgi:hypothetical protein
MVVAAGFKKRILATNEREYSRIGARKWPLGRTEIIRVLIREYSRSFVAKNTSSLPGRRYKIR